jgi:hypothetical protein
MRPTTSEIGASAPIGVDIGALGDAIVYGITLDRLIEERRGA